jgi:hypothetical protein
MAAIIDQISIGPATGTPMAEGLLALRKAEC